jgi:hypothetical protein
LSADKGIAVCAGCPGEADAECQIWGSDFCYPCARAWDAAAPTQEQVEAKYPEAKDRYAAFRKFTAEWAAKRRKKAEAA